jgi:hypothetical protein
MEGWIVINRMAELAYNSAGSITVMGSAHQTREIVGPWIHTTGDKASRKIIRLRKPSTPR